MTSRVVWVGDGDTIHVRLGAALGYFHHHPDFVLTVYRLDAEMVPAVEQAFAR